MLTNIKKFIIISHNDKIYKFFTMQGTLIHATLM